MANISVWIFDNKEAAEAQANARKVNGNETMGPIRLGSVDVTNRSGNSSTDEFFKKFGKKWGVVVIE